MSILVGATSGLAGAAGAAGGADLGDTIDQSLRFRGSNQFLRRNAGFGSGDANAYTFSTWVKLGEVPHASGDYHLISNAHSSHTSSAFIEYIAHTSDSIFRIFYFFGSVQYDIKSLGKYRDPSAWYHVVFAVDTNQGTASDRAKIYVNGVDVTDTSNSTFPGSGAGVLLTSGNEITVGSESVRDRFDLDGYLAETHFVDGSQLTADDFGRTNEDGIWVPDTYTGTHGTNGFHFTYSDSSDLGSDSSASNNDFTASGFDTGDVVLYSKDLTGSGSTYESDTANRTQALVDPFRAFDTDSANGVRNTASGGGFVYFNPETALTGVTGVRILFTSQTVGEARINGSTVTTTTSGNYQVLTLPSSPMTVNEIAIRRNQASTEVINYEIDQGSGFVQLVDNADNDVDYNDTPTSNYATVNPIRPRTSSIAPQKANLRAFASSTLDVYTMCSTQAIKHKAYMEVSIEDQHGGVNPGVGIVNGTLNMNQGTPYNKVGSYHYQSNGGGYHSGSYQGIVGQTWGTNGDVIGVIFDPDTGEFRTSVNGTVSSVLFTLSASELEEDWFFQIAQYHGSLCDLNYGQKDFIYTPPTGFTGLQTNNLPEPTITNGSDHFRALTGTGANILAIAQGTNTNGTNWNDDVNTGFTNGLWWIKDRANSNQHQLVDSVRGGNLALQCPNNAPETAYVAPAGNSVAWCWNYNSADPTVNGFEIIDPFEVTALQMTVPHNLGADPEFIISKFIDSSVVWRAWHKDLNASNTLFLSKQDAQTTSGCRVDNVTSTNFEWNSLQSSIDGNKNVMHYAWTSVPGYSAFGSYTGNSNADGPFIYTGFRPAFVMLKKTNATGQWEIMDSTVNPTNPAIRHLRADSTTSETNNTALAVDLLSNGFKLRNTNADLNSSNNFIYCCFAENPFGGENAPPATAR